MAQLEYELNEIVMTVISNGKNEGGWIPAKIMGYNRGDKTWNLEVIDSQKYGVMAEAHHVSPDKIRSCDNPNAYDYEVNEIVELHMGVPDHPQGEWILAKITTFNPSEGTWNLQVINHDRHKIKADAPDIAPRRIRPCTDLTNLFSNGEPVETMIRYNITTEKWISAQITQYHPENHTWDLTVPNWENENCSASAVQVPLEYIRKLIREDVQVY